MTQQVPEYGYNIQLYIDPISSYIQGRLYLAICWGYIQLYVRPIYSQIQGELYIARYRVYIQLDIRVGYIQLDIGSIYSQIQRKYVFVFFSTGSPLRMGAPQQKLFVITNSIQQQQRNGETATPFSGRLYRNPKKLVICDRNYCGGCDCSIVCNDRLQTLVVKDKCFYEGFYNSDAKGLLRISDCRSLKGISIGDSFCNYPEFQLSGKHYSYV